jgi:hypothetical protein
MDRAAGRFSDKWLKSNSNPIRNINRISPNWLMIAKVGPTLASKIRLWRPGKTRPSRDGPSISPAAISPQTTGCPKRCNQVPDARAAQMMTTNWAMTMSRILSMGKLDG